VLHNRQDKLAISSQAATQGVPVSKKHIDPYCSKRSQQIGHNHVLARRCIGVFATRTQKEISTSDWQHEPYYKTRQLPALARGLFA
jgi:hypothetical protein